MQAAKETLVSHFEQAYIGQVQAGAPKLPLTTIGPTALDTAAPATHTGARLGLPDLRIVGV